MTHQPQSPEPGGEPLWWIWVIYDHPKDYPDEYVARRQLAYPDGSVTFSGQTIGSSDLEFLRGLLRRQGLVCLPRDPRDDPVIVEVWL